MINANVNGLKEHHDYIIQKKERENGHLKSARILSTLGGNCRIRTNIPVRISGAKSKTASESISNTNIYFQTPPTEKSVIKDSAAIEKPALPETYLTDVATKKGMSFEVRRK